MYVMLLIPPQATGNDAKLVNIWDAATLAHLHTFRGHRDAVSGLAFRRKTRHVNGWMTQFNVLTYKNPNLQSRAVYLLLYVVYPYCQSCEGLIR